uniref:Uncharacterized protein n=1 Tax=Candidatus Methanophagaceae archaeon ANME-1 ERB6 TaxID=2759912 RepID=A0A7G9YSZ4_9EURY|nr:hypothetical protein OLNPMGDC_00019 [Methanosarcinales archaeon ANME-1 ERB6]
MRRGKNKGFILVLWSGNKKTTGFYNRDTTLFLFHKKKTCAKRKTMELFLVKVFTEGKKVVGKAFLSKNGFLVKISVILWLYFL